MLKENVKISVKTQVLYSMKWNGLNFLWIAILHFCSIKRKTIGCNLGIHTCRHSCQFCVYPSLSFTQSNSATCVKNPLVKESLFCVSDFIARHTAKFAVPGLCYEVQLQPVQKAQERENHRMVCLCPSSCSHHCSSAECECPHVSTSHDQELSPLADRKSVV